MNTNINQNLKLPIIRNTDSRYATSLTEGSLAKVVQYVHDSNNTRSKKALQLNHMRKWEESRGVTGVPKWVRYLNCGRKFKVYKCGNCGQDNITHTDSCNSRVCAYCCRKQYWRIKNRVWRPLEHYATQRGKYKKWGLKEITLTWKEDVQDADKKNLIKDRRNQMNKFLKYFMSSSSRGEIREVMIKGNLKVFETKRSSKDFSRVHIHAHILTVARYIPQRELSRKWKEISGNEVVWITPRTAEQGLTYLLKHIYKPPEILPMDIPMFLEIFEGRRRITGDGEFNDQWRRERHLPPLLDFTSNRAITLPLRCSNCAEELQGFVVMDIKQMILIKIRGIG